MFGLLLLTLLATLAGTRTTGADVIIQEDFEDRVLDGSLLDSARIIDPTTVTPDDPRETRLLSLVQGEGGQRGGAWLAHRIPLQGHRTQIEFDFWIRSSTTRFAGEGLAAMLQLGADFDLLGKGGSGLGICGLTDEVVAVAFDVVDQGRVDPETWCDGIGPKTCHAELDVGVCPGAESSTQTSADLGVEIPDLVAAGDRFIPVHVTMVIDGGELTVLLQTEADPAFANSRVRVLRANVAELRAPWALLGFAGSTSDDHDAHLEVDNVEVRSFRHLVDGEGLLAFGNLHEAKGNVGLKLQTRPTAVLVSGIGSTATDRVCLSLEALGMDESRRFNRPELLLGFSQPARPSPDANGRDLLFLDGEGKALGGLVIRDDLNAGRLGQFVCTPDSGNTGLPVRAELLLGEQIVATVENGTFTLPEVDDEVIVGFLRGRVGDPETYYKVTFTDLVVTSYQIGGGGPDQTRIDGVRLVLGTDQARKLEIGHYAHDYSIVEESLRGGETRGRALGVARVLPSPHEGKIILSNIGATGDDGIGLVPVSPAHFFEVEFDPIEPNPCGGPGFPGLDFCGFPEDPGEDDSPLATLAFRQDAEGIWIDPGFPALSPRRMRMGLFRHGVEVAELFFQPGEVLDLPPGTWPHKISLENEEGLLQLKTSLTQVARIDVGRGREREIDEICIDPVDPVGPGSLIAETCIQFICVDPIQIEPNYSLPPLPPDDLVPEALEVTQAIQDLDNSVRLVAGKRTFVRLHASSFQDSHATYAQLHLRKGQSEITINPLITHGFFGHIQVEENPDRAELDEAFLFELPPGWRSGTVEITGEINPITDWRSRFPKEFNYANNTITRTVSFETAGDMRLVMYRIGYPDSNSDNGIANGTILWPENWQVEQTYSWLERAYPIDNLQVIERTMQLSGNVPDDGRVINGILATLRAIDFINTALGIGFVHPNSHYYGLASDVGKFMRGWGWSNPPVASGPTGTSRWANPSSSSYWDDDGTYGDWYTGHELGHTFGRGHPGPGSASCGHSSSDQNYPYALARISGDQTGPQALYGFDFGSPRRVYEPDWSDVMSYCDFQWISDYTYEAILDGVQDDFGGGAGGGGGFGGAAGIPGAQRILVNGTVVEGEAFFLPLETVPDPGDLFPSTPGDWMVLLLDDQGEVLLRHPFTPTEGGAGPSDRGEPDIHGLVIQELVPLMPGTRDVEVLGPAGLVHAFSAGLTPPTVQLLSPDGGEQFDGEIIPVQWEASDVDGDELTFRLEYSDDDGDSWLAVAVNLEGFEVGVPRADLPSSNQARFRVTASDGIHASSDTSDGSFVVANDPPELVILEPAAPVELCPADTLVLMAAGHDTDVGRLVDEISWTSSLDGELGTGSRLVVHGLSLGVHEITATARDGKGGETSAVAPEVRVIATPFEGSSPVNALQVAPTAVLWELEQTDGSALVKISSVDPLGALRWTVASGPEWVSPENSNGQTPANLVFHFQDTGLEPGTHEGVIVLTSPDASGEAEIQVTVIIPEPEVTVGARFLRGDVNRDGLRDISDPIKILQHIFLGDPITCEDAADTDDDGTLSITDVIVELERQFLGGPEVPAPNARTGCGLDPTEDALEPCAPGRCR